MSKMNKFFKNLDKKYGSDGLFLADSPMCGDVEALTTGSYILDDILGSWGLPRGHIVQYAGREKSGKTFMSLMAIKHWQEKADHNWAYFVDAEMTYSSEWAEKLGLDNSRIIVHRENDGSKIFERLCGIPHKEHGKPKRVTGLLDDIIEAGGSDETGLGIVVIDSIAAIAPPLELASPSGKSNMALLGRFMPPELRKIVPLLKRSGVLLLAINQVRIDPSVMWGNPETSPGGSAWKHYCSAIVNFAMSFSKDKIIVDANDEQIGHTIIAKIDKTKHGPSFKKGEFIIEYTKGLHNTDRELRELGVKYGIVGRPNNRSYTYKDQKWTSKEHFSTAFSTEKEKATLLQEIKEAKLVGKTATKIKEDNDATSVPE